MDMTMEEVKDFGESVMPKKSLLKKVGRAALVILLTVVAGAVAAALSGLVVSLGANARLSGTQIVFDPLIALAYMALAHFLGNFYELRKPQQYKLFLFGLLLSFTINFVQGALTLVILLPVLKKLKFV